MNTSRVSACIVLALSLAACKSRDFNQSGVSSTGNVPLYLPTNEFFARPGTAWTGRLILPRPNERRADGGVWMEVYSAPRGVKAPTRVWLAPDPGASNMQDLLARTRIDISFARAGAAHIEAARKSNSILPERLNGWSHVSFLETLAGSRPTSVQDVIGGQPTADSVEVLVRDTELIGDLLLTKAAPVQIVGREVALLKFGPPQGPNQYPALHWTGSAFDGQPEVITFDTPMMKNVKTVELPTVQDIEKSASNIAGWYAYGEHVNGKFVVRALEPRRLMSTNPDSVWPDGEKYIHTDNFLGEKYRKGRASSAVIQKDNQVALQVGQRGLVMHIFGGLGGPNGDNAPILPLSKKALSTGHFAFGTGEVMVDPFTGRPKIDIEYKQVYAHNPNAIVAGSQKWHAYAGSLQRGWMYTRPFSDVFIFHPAFSVPYDFGAGRIDLLSGLSHELEVMMARFRSGDGWGLAEVTATNSCVQDSNQALYIGIMKFLSWTQENPGVRAFMQNNGNSEMAQRLRKLNSIMQEYRSNIVGRASLRDDWREGMKADLAIHKDEPIGQLGQILSAIESRKVLVPRWAYDDIASMLYNNGALLWFLRTDQIGGNRPESYPLAPGFDN